MTRHMVTLNHTIVIDFPEGMEIDSKNPETENYLREEFIDYLQSAQQIELYFDIDEDEEEEAD